VIRISNTDNRDCTKNLSLFFCNFPETIPSQADNTEYYLQTPSQNIRKFYNGYKRIICILKSMSSDNFMSLGVQKL
jgi:hypothetical protein